MSHTKLAVRVPQRDGRLTGFDSITKIVEEIL
jgi:hypothetical protein